MSLSSEAVKTWRRNTKRRMVQAMGEKCVICGYDRCPDAFDFHHLDPAVKEFTFAAIRVVPRSWAKITAELKKCVLLCATCHREVHAGLAIVPKNASRFDTAWEDYRLIEQSIEETTYCSICQHTKRPQAKYCSLKCAGLAHQRIDWDKYDLEGLLQTNSIVKVAEILCVSDMAVRKRIKKLARRVGFEPTVGFPPTD